MLNDTQPLSGTPSMTIQVAEDKIVQGLFSALSNYPFS